MRRSPWVLLAVLGPMACGGSSTTQKVAAAAIGVSAAVAAAAINRAATDECWGSCPTGTMCDHDSGLCVGFDEAPISVPSEDVRWYPCDPKRFQCEPDEWLACDAKQCDWYRCVDSEPECVLSRPDDCTFEEDCAAKLQGRVASSRPVGPLAPNADPCRGLCFGNERCVVESGVANCIE